jgi:hypothetical protein
MSDQPTIETWNGVPCTRCGECGIRIQLGGMPAHTYTAHPDLVRTSITCLLCNRTLRDPINVPVCKPHPPAYCLQCFFHEIIKTGQGTKNDVQCPVCFSDVKDGLPRCIAGVPEFDDILPMHLETFIDKDKTDQIFTIMRQNDIKYLKEMARKKIKSVNDRQKKLISIQFDMLVEECQLDRKSVVLLQDSTNYLMRVTNDHASKKIPSSSTRDSSRRTCNVLGVSNDDVPNNTSRMTSLSLLDKQMHHTIQMKEKNERLVRQQRVAQKEHDRRKKDSLQREADKRTRLEHVTTHRQQKLLLQKKNTSDASKTKQQLAQAQRVQANLKFQQDNQNRYLKAQSLMREAELRSQYQKELLAHQRNVEKQHNQTLRQLRLKKIQNMETKRQEQGLLLLHRLDQQDEQVTRIQESKERLRMRHIQQHQEKKKQRTARIQSMIKNERNTLKRRSLSLQENSLGSAASLAAMKQKRMEQLKERSAIKEEVQRTLLMQLQEEQHHKTNQLLASIHQKNQAIRQNRKTRMGVPPQNWMSPQVYGTCTGTKKKQTKKRKKTKNTMPGVSFETMGSLFQSPTSLLPPLGTSTGSTCSDNTKGNNNTNDVEANVAVVLPPSDLIRLMDQQRSHMVLLVDEEEQMEKERILSLRRSKSIRRKQVAKCFNWKRQVATERLLRMQMEHQSAIDALTQKKMV